MADQPVTLPGEEWRDVVGYEGLYMVSSLGRVRSLDRPVNSKNGSVAIKRGRLLAPYINPQGYPTINLSKHGRSKTLSVHPLVCAAFNGVKPSVSAQCAHWDGDRANNRPENLRWTDAKGNAEDRNRHGTAPIGEAAPNRRLNERSVLEIRALYTGNHGDLAKLGRQFGVTSMQILHIVKRRQWTHI